MKSECYCYKKICTFEFLNEFLNPKRVLIFIFLVAACPLSKCNARGILEEVLCHRCKHSQAIQARDALPLSSPKHCYNAGPFKMSNSMVNLRQYIS